MDLKKEINNNLIKKRKYLQKNKGLTFFFYTFGLTNL